jgi:hypothetical protein
MAVLDPKSSEKSLAWQMAELDEVRLGRARYAAAIRNAAKI